MLDIDSLTNMQLLNTLFEYSFNSIAITDAQLELPGPKFVYVNPAFVEKTGYTFEELKDKTPRILQGEDTNKDVLKELKDKCKKGEFFQGSTINYRKDGSSYYVEWNISPIKDEKGNITHYISIQKDISTEVEYKKVLEEKVKHQEKELELKDTIVSQNTRLALMGEMIDSVAHQWKQPLNIMNLQTQMLSFDFKSGKMNKEYINKYINNIEDQIMHMNETLNEFRNFLRPNKQKEDFEIQDTINSVDALVKNELVTYNIELKYNIQDNFVINGFKNEFKHILLNLINNSKDAFIQNNIKNRNILIETHSLDTTNKIIYKDNAGGIPDDIKDKIFEINFTTKEQLNGTGMGLYMCKKILQNHNAEIYIDSFKNSTIFQIDIKK